VHGQEWQDCGQWLCQTKGYNFLNQQEKRKKKMEKWKNGEMEKDML